MSVPNPSLIEAEQRQAAEARIGATLRGKWRLDELLGIGGVAAVYVATHRNGMRAAIKILHADHAARKETTLRFLREGYLANRVDHPGIVRILDDDVSESGEPYLVMELLEGESLASYAARWGGRVPTRDALWIVGELCEIAHAAHVRGVVHRDIKPENVFVTDDDHIKVLDFGLASLKNDSMWSSGTTRTGYVMGTPAYMSPEQARGRWREVDAQSDVFSIGTILFELLSGEPIFDGDQTVTELVARIFSEQARSITDAVPDIDPDLANVVDQAIRLEKSERFVDADAMRRAISRVHTTLFGSPLLAAQAMQGSDRSIRTQGDDESGDSLPPFVRSEPRASDRPSVTETTTLLPRRFVWDVRRSVKRQPWLPVAMLGAGLALLSLALVTMPSARSNDPHAASSEDDAPTRPTEEAKPRRAPLAKPPHQEPNEPPSPRRALTNEQASRDSATSPKGVTATPNAKPPSAPTSRTAETDAAQNPASAPIEQDAGLQTGVDASTDIVREVDDLGSPLWTSGPRPTARH